MINSTEICGSNERELRDERDGHAGGIDLEDDSREVE